jgi:hypothetical protein
VAAQLGLPTGDHVIGGCLVGLIFYGIALHWFIARRGLDLSRGRAALLVLAADLLTGFLVVVPRLLVEGS